MRTTSTWAKLTLAGSFMIITAGAAAAQEQQPGTGEVSTATAADKGRTADKATIYFYRIKQYAGSALEPSVYCDEKELARMDNGRYFGVTLERGKHTCRMGDKQTGFELELKPGEEYYAKITIDVGLLKGHGRLTLLQKEQGAFELKRVKLLSADKVKDRSLVTIFEGTVQNSER